MKPLRVAAVSYLNAQPLVADLNSDDRLQVMREKPSEVARRLVAGEADLGLIPCVALLEDPELTWLPGVCIGARGPVDSVFLYLKDDVAEGRAEGSQRIVLDPGSRSSQMLTRIYLEDLCGLSPETLVYDEAEVDEAFRQNPSGVLVIGDPAMGRAAPSGFRRIDLAAAWQAKTGLPFVFAVWGLKRDLLNRHPWLPERFQEALRRAREDLPGLVANFSGRVAVSPEEATRYLRENIAFELGREEEAGMKEFLRRAESKRL